MVSNPQDLVEVMYLKSFSSHSYSYRRIAVADHQSSYKGHTLPKGGKAYRVEQTHYHYYGEGNAK